MLKKKLWCSCRNDAEMHFIVEGREFMTYVTRLRLCVCRDLCSMHFCAWKTIRIRLPDMLLHTPSSCCFRGVTPVVVAKTEKHFRRCLLSFLCFQHLVVPVRYAWGAADLLGSLSMQYGIAIFPVQCLGHLQFDIQSKRPPTSYILFWDKGTFEIFAKCSGRLQHWVGGTIAYIVMWFCKQKKSSCL